MATSACSTVTLGGAGTASGILKGNGAGVVSAAVAGTANCKLDVWNYYNRAAGRMQRRDTTAGWTYATAGSWRQANGASGNQCNFIVGLAEDTIQATVNARYYTSNTSYVVLIGIGFDTASAATSNSGTTSTTDSGVTVYYCDYPSIGTHYLAWTEYLNGGGTLSYQASGSAPHLIVNILY